MTMPEPTPRDEGLVEHVAEAIYDCNPDGEYVPDTRGRMEWRNLTWRELTERDEKYEGRSVFSGDVALMRDQARAAIATVRAYDAAHAAPDALVEQVRSQVRFTEAQVDERLDKAHKAYDTAYWRARGNYPASVSAGDIVDRICKREGLRAAIAAVQAHDAALPAPPSLEAIPGLRGVWLDRGLDPAEPDRWSAELWVGENGARVFGDGPTIEDAVRAAITAAQEGAGNG